MTGYLSDYCKITTALDYAEANTDREGATLDMQGFDGVLMIVKTAAIHNSATYKIKAQQGALANATDMADLEGTGQTIAGSADNGVFFIDVFQPRERYVRLFVDKDTTNNCAESAVYVQYKARFEPVTQPAGVSGEQHLSPAEGTA
ncbi:MAG: hypothetical protein EOM21_21355 [Gammaproteobacteria bacterium]|nr:hypothetical protein [Gammaproteobacteria bacterium]